MEAVKTKEIPANTAVSFNILRFRAEGVTERDVASLYGVDPFRPLEKLFQDKVELEDSSIENTEEDERVIKKAIDLFAEETVSPWDHGHYFCQHQAVEVLKAELRAASFTPAMIAHVAIVTRELFEKLRDSDERIPARYELEILHQMITSGINRGYVVFTVDGTEILSPRVPYDAVFASDHMAACILFWDHVRRGAPLPEDFATLLGQPNPSRSEIYQPLLKSECPELTGEVVL